MGTLSHTCTKHNTFTASSHGCFFFKGQKAVEMSENVFILRGKWLMEKGLRKNKWEVGAVVLGAKKKKKNNKNV